MKQEDKKISQKNRQIPQILTPPNNIDLLIEQAIPIEVLENNQNQFVIKVRLINKQNQREYTVKQQQGRYFKCDLLDNEGNKIKATFFNESCEKYYKILDEGRVYLVKDGKVSKNEKYGSGVIIDENRTEIYELEDKGDIK